MMQLHCQRGRGDCLCIISCENNNNIRSAVAVTVASVRLLCEAAVGVVYTERIERKKKL